MFKHILLPADGSPAANGAMAAAVKFAADAGARISALHVIADFHIFTYQPDMLQETRDAYLRDSELQARKVLEQVAQLARAAKVPCELLQRRSDKPYEAILTVAHEYDCDLIAMATHGYTGLKGALLGSETHKVLIHSQVPVLVLRAM